MIPNTKADIQIETVKTNSTEDSVLIIKDRPEINGQPIVGGGITSPEMDSTIYGAAIVYEF